MTFVETWNETRTQRLIEAWADGRTADAIAAELEISRNSVLSKVRRLRGQGVAMEERESPIIRKPRPSATAVTFAELTARTCRWPLGGFYDPVEHYCGAATAVQGASYCRDHLRQAHQPMRKDVKPVEWGGSQTKIFA